MSAYYRPTATAISAFLRLAISLYRSLLVGFLGFGGLGGKCAVRLAWYALLYSARFASRSVSASSSSWYYDIWVHKQDAFCLRVLSWYSYLRHYSKTNKTANYPFPCALSHRLSSSPKTLCGWRTVQCANGHRQHHPPYRRSANHPLSGWWGFYFSNRFFSFL